MGGGLSTRLARHGVCAAGDNVCAWRECVYYGNVGQHIMSCLYANIFIRSGDVR